MSDAEVVRNAGRCDRCGKPISMADGDTLAVSGEADFESDEPVVSPADVADAVARALESIGDAKDAMLAESIREQIGYKLHDRCLEESSLSDLYTDEWDAGGEGGE